MAFRWIGDRHQRVSKRYTTSSSAIAKIVALMVNSIPRLVHLMSSLCSGRCHARESVASIHAVDVNIVWGSDESMEMGIFGILYSTVTESSRSSSSFAALCELKFVKA